MDPSSDDPRPRSSTRHEARGRSRLYVATLSGTGVTLALVAALDGPGRTFDVAAVSLLPAVLAVGLTTYVRLADLGVREAFCVRAVDRRRDPPTREADLREPRWHHPSHAATVVAALTAVVAGGLYALTAHLARRAPAPMVGAGATVFALGVFVLFVLDHHRRWRQAAAVHPRHHGHHGAPFGSQVLGGPARRDRDRNRTAG